MIDPQDAQPRELAPLLEKVLAAASPNVVFSQPVEAGGYTVITASEVFAGGGFGYGGGSGPTDAQTAAADAPQASGHGGGGGGGSSGRPVAVISIGPDGVKVDPVVDVTKLGIAAITAWGALALFLARFARRAG
jgi:uncharacterized spore protein YtfJ